MNVYVWSGVCGLTKRYHDSGGAVAVAENEDVAWAMVLAEVSKPAYDGDDSAAPCPKREKPDAVFVTDAGAVPAVFVFPNAGCC